VARTTSVLHRIQPPFDDNRRGLPQPKASLAKMVRPSPTVVVVGCTGHQGRAVADALLQSKSATVRGLTRSPDKPAARELAQRGAEIVRGDLTDPASLKQAFTGATSLFLVTDFMSGLGPVSEYDQGMNAVRAAIDCGVRTIVFRYGRLCDAAFATARADLAAPAVSRGYPRRSTEANAEGISRGRYKVDHFTNKYKLECRIRELRQQGRFDAAVFVRPGYYWQNLLGFLTKPTKEADGSFSYTVPVDPARTAVPGLDIHDLGPVVARLLERAPEYDGQVINVAAEVMTLAQIAERLGQGTCRAHGREQVGRAGGKGLRRSPYVATLPPMPHVAFSLRQARRGQGRRRGRGAPAGHDRHGNRDVPVAPRLWLLRRRVHQPGGAAAAPADEGLPDLLAQQHRVAPALCLMSGNPWRCASVCVLSLLSHVPACVVHAYMVAVH